ncbi:MAG: hypothetical protein U0V02_19315 [Anaerolineales bacterium]
MNYLFSSPSVEDLIRLLRAWRFWLVGALLGALFGAAFYYIAPPPYRAKATVNVDFNLEQAWPKETDRQQFYYLEREARKMEELAWSDEIMGQLSSQFAIPAEDLRGGKLLLSQPSDAGWHFYADDKNAKAAEELVSAWAEAFTLKIQSEVETGNINEFVKLELTQAVKLPKQRSISLGEYMLAGAMTLLTLAVVIVLFIKPKNK